MSLWSRIRDRLGGAHPAQTPGEADAPVDTGTARTRPTGGVPDPGAADTHSTTGTTPSQTFVGRASGEEPGDSDITGAEARGDDDEGGAARANR
jgi:hypothetical protein